MRRNENVSAVASGEQGPRTAPRQIRSHRVAELMASDIRRRILERELLETHTLPPEAELMAEYGVSRPTLREALRLLEAERLIVVRRGGKGGAIIRQPNLDEAARQFSFLLNYRGVTLGDLHHARLIIEPPALASLAVAATPEQIADLKSQLAAARVHVNDQSHHRSLLCVIRERMVEMTGSVTTTMVMRLLQYVHDNQTTGFPIDHNGKLQGLSQKSHEHMMELIADGDVQGAESYWREHLLQVRKHFGERSAEPLFAADT